MRRRVSLGMVSAALVAAVLAAGLGRSAADVSQEPTPSRKIIFVEGMNSDANCQLSGGFAALATRLKDKSAALLQDEDFLGFSYSGQYCPSGSSPYTNFTAKYGPEFTCGSIDPEVDSLGHSQRFGMWFHSLPGDGIQYDIVAHSMGGVVVSYWLATMASDDDLRKLHSVVTLDSPLRGVDYYHLLGGQLISLPTCPTDDDRWADLAENSPVIAALRDAPTRAPFVTIRNASDQVVPAAVADLSHAWLDRLFDDACNVLALNHECVFSNEISGQAIVEAVLHAGEPAEGQATNDWPMSRHDPAKTGYNSAETILTPPLALKWILPGPQAPGTWSAMGQPAATAARLYVEGSRAGAYGLFELDAATGAELRHVGDQPNPPCTAIGEAINRDEPEAPALADGNIYFAGHNDLVGLRSDGTCLWQQSNWNGSPLPADGLLWAIRCGAQPGFIPGAVGFDPQTGAAVRSFKFTSWFPPSHGNGSFYPSHGCGGTGPQAFDDTTGLNKWSRGDGPANSSPVLEDGVVYATGSDFYSTKGVAEAFDAISGATLWRFEENSNLFRLFPVVASGVLYFGSQNGTFYALNTDPAAGSRVRWTASTGGAINSTPVVANGVVYLGSNDDKIYAADALTGALLWSYQTPCVVDGPLVVADGVLYVRGKSLQGGSCRPALYAFEASATTATPTPTPTTSVTKTVTATPTACPTDTVLVGSGCATITPTVTATPTSTVTRTPTPTGTATRTPTPTPLGLVGDANKDGQINSIDALLVLQYSAGLISSINPDGDADQHGDINAIDAALILQFDARLIDHLGPASTPTPTPTRTPAPDIRQQDMSQVPAIRSFLATAGGQIDPAQIIYADLTEDGVDDAVVPVSSGGEDFALFVYGYGPDGLAELLRVTAAPITASVTEGMLQVDGPQYAPGDPVCCPSQRKRTTYRWDGQQLAVVEVQKLGTLLLSRHQ